MTVHAYNLPYTILLAVASIILLRSVSIKERLILFKMIFLNIIFGNTLLILKESLCKLDLDNVIFLKFPKA